MLAVVLGLLVAAPGDPLPVGKAVTRVDLGGTELLLHTYKPPGYTDGPLIVVFHGLGRNAAEYRDLASGLGDRCGALIAAPEFDEDRFPYWRYSRLGVVDRDGAAAPEAEWTFPLVPRLVEAIRRREGRPDLPFYLLGHSAGGQFVGRLTALADTGARRHVAANPGGYVFPTPEIGFPYGFGSLPDSLAGPDALRAYLARPLTIYLGTADTGRDDDLDTSPEADAQGASRLERGRAAFEAGHRLARRNGWPFGWQLVEARGVGHDAGAMFDDPACAVALFGDDIQAQTRKPGDTITNTLGMKLAWIPAGEFLMGTKDPEDVLAKAFPQVEAERIRDINDEPAHPVRINRPFYMGTHEVTIGQFKTFLAESGYRTEPERDGTGGWGIDLAKREFLWGRDPRFAWYWPGFYQWDDHPVVNITWNDAVAFCEWLSKKEGRTYRLPTEAEWEYACRAGSSTLYNFGDDPAKLVESGNTYDADCAREFPEWQRYSLEGSDGFGFTAPVGRFPPNAWGLHDMHGNAWEWCSDWYDPDYYRQSPVDDPQGPERTSGQKVRRGGAWHTWSIYCRSAYRNYNTRVSRYLNLGLRVVMEDPAAAQPEKDRGTP
jgi:sulfatase modifying factor 1